MSGHAAVDAALDPPAAYETPRSSALRTFSFTALLLAFALITRVMFKVTGVRRVPMPGGGTDGARGITSGVFVGSGRGTSEPHRV